jgi:hypothetical protein
MNARYIPCLYLLGVLLTTAACNDDHFIDTGKANGRFNGSMLAYLRSDSYNWDSTVLIIERAGLQDLFEGKDASYPAITFFGPTNHSIRQYLLENTNGHKKIADMPAQLCRDLILQYVFPEKKMKADFAVEVRGTNTGGTMLTCLGGNALRVYRIQSDFNGVQGAGPESLGIETYTSLVITRVASSDIEPQNGVVHALSYSFKFGNF